MKLAIIGCGAIVESFYVPAINKSKCINKIYLIDRNVSRAREVQNLLNIDTQVLDNYHTILNELDGVIIATPPSSHFSIAKDFLNNSIPILIEKPLVESAAEINELIDLSKKTNGKLVVNNTRRYFPANKAIKKALVNGKIGEIKKIFYHEGGEYNWPTVSGFYFNKEANDKGVMMDRGAHVIDLICWWLDDEIEVIQFEDDSLGGPEAFCHAVMRSDYCEIDVKLSWLNKLSNEYRIVGIDGDISGSIYNWKSYELTKNGKKRTIKVQHKEDLFDDFGQTVFENFIKMIIGDSNRISINASDVLQSIELIEKMYNNRQKINSPWQDRWLNYAE